MTQDTEQWDGIRDGLRVAIEKLPKQVKMRARSSLEGFDKARQLLPLDREIASFRAITAEEEAVAALFKSLQLMNYPGSERLSLYSHLHKAAVAPFIAAVKHALTGGKGKLNIGLTLDMAEPSITVHVLLKQFGIEIPGRENLSLQLVEPLGVLGAKEDGSSPTSFYDSHISKVASSANAKSMLEFIRQEANARNLLLYASDMAVPSSRATPETIEIRQRRAETCLLLSIAVLQIKTHQIMASQGLAAFLKMLKIVTDDDPFYPVVKPDVVIRPQK
jgi:hypothetical protein